MQAMSKTVQFDFAKASAELAILRDFVDFVNHQVGVYCDCLAGFQGNKIRIERQVARVVRAVSRRVACRGPRLELPRRYCAIHK